VETGGNGKGPFDGAVMGLNACALFLVATTVVGCLSMQVV
jgi:hypothetical protein